MNDCLFCRIVGGEIPAKIRYENNKFIAFDDINPNAPVHILIIPKKHIASVNDLKEEDSDLMGRMILLARNIAKKNNLDQSGYRLIINSGPDAGQVVFHLHMHILGGKKLGRIA